MRQKSTLAVFVLAATILATSAHAAVKGSAETVSCSLPFGGISGVCKMEKTPAAPFLGIGVKIDDWDRLRWNCTVKRINTLIGSKTTWQNVPSRKIGAKWSTTSSVVTGEHYPLQEYCTRNKSFFWYSANHNGPPTSPPPGGRGNIDATHCIWTPYRTRPAN